MVNIIFSLFWLIVLLFAAFWVAVFGAFFYILILPFTACIEALEGLTDFLLKMVQFPRYCAKAMIHGKGCGDDISN